MNTKNRGKRLTILCAAAVSAMLLMTSCTPTEAGVSAVEDVNPKLAEALKSEGTIEFADNLYLESSVQAHLMSKVVNELGGDAKVIQGGPAETLAAMDKGQPIVMLDIWKWQYPELWKKYVEDGGTVLEVGTSDYTGEEGWYVPTYVIKGDPERGIEASCPGLPDWEALNECADVFSTAKTGSKGQYMSGAESWALHYGDPQRIKNLNLDYEMVFAGSEASLFAELTRAYEQGEPWLGLMWRPNYMTTKYDLTRVDFPEHTDECWGETYACQWPNTEIFQIASSVVKADHPAVWGILQNYSLNDEQLRQLQSLVIDEGMTPAEAAESWMKDNREIWTQWI